MVNAGEGSPTPLLAGGERRGRGRSGVVGGTPSGGQAEEGRGAVPFCPGAKACGCRCVPARPSSPSSAAAGEWTSMPVMSGM